LMRQSDISHFYFELICKCVTIGALLYLKTVADWSFDMRWGCYVQFVTAKWYLLKL